MCIRDSLSTGPRPARPPTPHFYWPGRPAQALTSIGQTLTSIDPYSLLICTSPSPRRDGLATKTWSPPPGGADSMHRRSNSEPGAMLSAYAGLGWRILGHLGAMLAPSWLQLGHLGVLLGHLGAILAPTWPSWPDLGSLLGNLKLLWASKINKNQRKMKLFQNRHNVGPC